MNKLLKKALNKYRNGDSRGAEELYRKILRDDRGHVDGNYLLGALLAERGEIERALKYTERAALAAPHSPYIHNNLGNIARLSGDLERAAQCYQRAVELQPDMAEAYNNLGVVFKRLGQWDVAMVHYRQALDINPLFVEAHYNLGKVCADQGDDAGAMTYFLRVLELQPEHTRALEGLGNEHLRRNEREQALSYFKRYLHTDPADVCGVRIKIAWLNEGAVPEKYPDALVRHTYETKAATWDQDVARPDMCFLGPEHVRIAFLQWVAARRELKILDLGCGTGACGVFLRDVAQRMEGVDLSAPMLRIAQEKNLYDALHNDEIGPFLKKYSAAYDVIIASGVLIFVGDLTSLFAEVRTALRAQGAFIFTVYRSENAEVSIRDNFHFAHSEAHIRTCARTVGLAVNCIEPVVHEYENGVAQPGYVVTLTG